MKLLSSSGAAIEAGAVTQHMRGLAGSIRVPGDKSISHRSIMLGSLANGITRVTGFLEGADALATLNAFRAMGVEITGPVNGEVTITAVGMHGLKQPGHALDMGNSGTSMRLLSGLLAAQPFSVTLTGEESLSRRPMSRVANPLNQMGAKVETEADGTPPVQIQGGQALKGMHYELPVASAQIKSCVLLAGLYAEGETVVVEPAPTRDHTERMLQGFGYPVSVEGDTIKVEGGGELSACAIDVPADISSAAFFMVAATLVPDSELTLTHVGINPTRTGIIDILNLMGADITLSNERTVGGEPVADIVVRSAELTGIEIPDSLVPLAIDEFPALFIAAACAKGKTVLTGAEELRVKESDRIQAMVDGLVALGVDAVGTDDGAIIQGGQLGKSTETVSINCHHDHRIAMSFAIAASQSICAIQVDDCDNIATSFPNFVELANAVGLSIQQS